MPELALSADEAMVLSEWLYDHTDDELSHGGTRQALWNLEATLERLVDELFVADYTQRLERAEARLTPAEERTPHQRRLVAEHPRATASDPVAHLTADEAVVIGSWIDEAGAPQPDGPGRPAVRTALLRLRQLLRESVPPHPDHDVAAARERLDWGKDLGQ